MADRIKDSKSLLFPLIVFIAMGLVGCLEEEIEAVCESGGLSIEGADCSAEDDGEDSNEEVENEESEDDEDYNYTNSLDSTFGESGTSVIDFSTNYFFSDIAIDSSGRLVLAGYFHDSSIGKETDFALIRLKADGSVDSSFGDDGFVKIDRGYYDYVTSVTLQSDGKIIAAGYTLGNYNSDSQPIAFRLDSDGILDSSFGSSGVVEVSLAHDGSFSESLVDSTGRIVLVGGERPTQSQGLVVRLLSDGSLDTSFSGDGMMSFDLTYDVYVAGGALQNDDKIVVYGSTRPDNVSGGSYTVTDLLVARIATDGSLDSSFGTGGFFVESLQDSGRIRDLKIQPDGKFVFTGDYYFGEDSSDVAPFVGRLEIGGSWDSGFGESGVTLFAPRQEEAGYSIEVDSDGKIYVAGLLYIDDINQGRLSLVRFLSDGTLDTSFAESGVAVTNNRASLSESWRMQIQNDDSPVAVGISSVVDEAKNQYVKETHVLRFSP
jgi:uncharacterized delta-60 repeat protein